MFEAKTPSLPGVLVLGICPGHWSRAYAQGIGPGHMPWALAPKTLNLWITFHV